MSSPSSPSAVEALTAARTRIQSEVGEATESWSKVDKALSKVLRTKQKDNLRTLNAAEDGRTWQPLLQGADPGKGKLAAYSSGSEDESIGKMHRSCSSLDALRHKTRQGAEQARARCMRVRAAENALRLHDHAKRRLRVKIADVLKQVGKRRELHVQQEKARKFREAKFATGRAPSADLGDADEYAIGVPAIGGHHELQGLPSPRRSAILDSLTDEDLELLRKDVPFYFQGSILQNDSSIMALQQDSISQHANPASKDDLEAAFEEFIVFFTPERDHKTLPAAEWRHKLRALLNPPDSPKKDMNTLEGSPKHKALSNARSSPEKPKAPLEMMPCMGRHPIVRWDQESPTLAKVREVWNRRDAADRKWVEDKRHTMVNRMAQNAFKAREQQREIQLAIFKQKELHKVQMLEAEERKAMIDAAACERADQELAQKMEKVQYAIEKADDMIEQKRDAATLTLNRWMQGAERCEKFLHEKERMRRRIGQSNYEDYMAKLEKIGESRHNTAATLGQQNEELRSRIKVSLKSQLEEKQQQKANIQREALEAKLDAAAERRRNITGRYCFAPKAFGANAAGFDPKYHTVSIDRRDMSWQKAHAAWSRAKGSFSSPDLSAAANMQDDALSDLSPDENLLIQQL